MASVIANGGQGGIRPDGLIWVTTTGLGTTTWGLGGHNASDNYNLIGPVRGVIFPRILTQSEVQAVISRIAGIL